MEFLWILCLIAVITGGMIGIGITLALHQNMRRKLKVLEDVEKEYESYKNNVTRHFVGTAGLVNQLTQSYKAVYDHLEQGAVELVGEEKLKKELGTTPQGTLLESLTDTAAKTAALQAPGNSQEAQQVEPEPVHATTASQP